MGRRRKEKRRWWRMPTMTRDYGGEMAVTEQRAGANRGAGVGTEPKQPRQ